jgi:transaldolase
MQPTAATHEGLRAAAARYSEVNPARVVLKLAANAGGLRLARELAPQGVRFAFTACYGLPQAYCGTQAGAEWIIPYFGRLRRTGVDACQRMHEMVALLARQQARTRILAASLKSPADVLEVTLAGVQDVTAPPEVIRALAEEPLTETAVAQFAADWERFTASLG